MSEKRKGDDSSSAIKKKMRTYLESYLNFGFMEGTDKTRPECVICREKLANESMKPSKMKRHQQTMHPETVGRDRDFFIKKQHLAKANKPMDIRTAFVRAGSDAQKATEASFECALLIAKAKKPHNIGEQLIKPACIKMVEKLCGPQVAEKLKTVPLSNNTVKDRIDKMASNCELQLLEKLGKGPFAIQLDETTTVADEAVLIVYVQYIDGEDLKQDILMSVNLTTTTRGEDIFTAVDSYLSSHNLSYENLVACCTDGAASMMGKNKGFNSRLKEKAPHCTIFHCVIHRQALASKKLSEDLSETLSTVVKIVNFIKGRPTNKRLFADLCEDEAHQTLLLHTEVRWLSRGRVLARFVELKEKIEEFLQTRNCALSEQVTESFWIKTAYLADIFSLYNETNKRLQGVESNILQCKETFDAFVRKLECRVGKMERGELQQFPLLLKQSQNNPETVPVSVRREFIRHMNALQTEMQSRFADIDEYVSKELWVLDPFIAKIEDVEYLDCEDELTDIQADSLSKKYFQEKGFKKFWIVKGPSLAPKLTLHATTRIILPFSTTYLSETAFSALVAIKTKARNTLDVHNDFRLAVTHITPDIPSLAAGVQAQGSH
ncbi:zinc finger BED domain-containing protein 5-like [Pseudochaenichthys georgianus]|uniref:zinc finger BED domain-containing protein 5-like n=1 Tax=Pseudochaenichthys georgianus TaxID=52239 RepID=UPI00146C67AD|nr:zinc finger BED domain-containing protein 5-like [Pseudochaenichthys georgianus]XP_033946286.1 zinc finger BED domain-containing protein 5-like [Pseudochaenichthys georgianus]